MYFRFEYKLTNVICVWILNIYIITCVTPVEKKKTKKEAVLVKASCNKFEILISLNLFKFTHSHNKIQDDLSSVKMIATTIHLSGPVRFTTPFSTSISIVRTT